ncbi:hypothetical protein CAC42_2306 [Sphaceloma murrayae]|uniref:Uncharacterized protein n=1 Tax=Sphaceloma murrayae TaxID=2082308 RepID=A0A2K1QIW0_9PEZI|nr:hypothetical protein CAC42_2306 [Sphaceloma murrayae]
MSKLTHLFSVLMALAAGVVGTQSPVESYQRWLMIIKPNVVGPAPYTGALTQPEVDNITFAFLNTWPETISSLTSGRLQLETHVLVSPCPLTSTSKSYPGMITPDDLPDDVAVHVSPDLWDGVAVYAAFTEHAMWGISSAANVGWFSVSHTPNLTADSWAMAAWTHEYLHTLAWYFGNGRLGNVAPVCNSARDGRDGTHCGEEIGYRMGEQGRKDLLGYYGDYLNGVVRREGGRTGLGSRAWKLGTRREAYMKVQPGGLVPGGLKKREVWDGEAHEKRQVTPWNGDDDTGTAWD